MARVSRQLADAYRCVTADIFKYAEAMHFVPTGQQSGIMQAVMDAHYKKASNWIAVKSGQGPGKTTVAAIIAGWRSLQCDVDPRTGGVTGALTVVTAPTMRQCTDVWLAEFRSLLKKADPWLRRIFNCTKTRIEIAGDPNWGVRLVTATREENAQGYHNKRLTVIMEEASGIPREIVTQFKGTLSNPDALLLQIGNPNTRDCAFFDSFYGPGYDRWVHFTFNAEDTARDYPHIVNPQRNLDLENEFGRESDVYRIRVLGEFPHSDPNCVISGDDIEKAFVRDAYQPSITRRSSEFGGDLAKQIGLDFARYGGDESMVYLRQGYAILSSKRFVRRDPSEAVDAAFQMQHRMGWSDRETMYVPDAGGMGQGLMHKFYQAHKRVLEFHNGASSSRPRQYANKVTEGWFHLGRLLKADMPAIPRDHTLLTQLSGRRYYTNVKGQLVLETKDEYMKRGFDSPDRGDGCIMTFWDDVLAVGQAARMRS